MGLKQLEDVTYFRLNNEINRPINGQIMLHKDKEALEAFFKILYLVSLNSKNKNKHNI